MILPIYAYGQPVLRRKAQPIADNFENVEQLIKDMWDTMYNAKGVGLAAPQIGKSIRLFLVDTVQVLDEDEESNRKGIKKVFINPEIIEEEGSEWTYEEGCLSIPNITGDVERKEVLKLKYLDDNFEEHTEVFQGMNARVIQHEYDHIEGTLFTEKLKPLKKKLIKRKLEAIRKGNVKAEYRLKFII